MGVGRVILKQGSTLGATMLAPSWHRRAFFFFLLCGQLRKHKKFRVLWLFFVLFTALMCSSSILNWLKRVKDGSFLFLCKTLVFLVLAFLNLGDQIRCSQNQYTNLKSALDQPLASIFIFQLCFKGTLMQIWKSPYMFLVI